MDRGWKMLSRCECTVKGRWNESKIHYIMRLEGELGTHLQRKQVLLLNIKYREISYFCDMKLISSSWNLPLLSGPSSVYPTPSLWFCWTASTSCSLWPPPRYSSGICDGKDGRQMNYCSLHTGPHAHSSLLGSVWLQGMSFYFRLYCFISVKSVTCKCDDFWMSDDEVVRKIFSLNSEARRTNLPVLLLEKLLGCLAVQITQSQG